MLLGALLPLLGEGAVAAGAPAFATRTAVGHVTGQAFAKMSIPARMAAREAQYQLGNFTGQEKPAPTQAPDPRVDQLLQNNDLTPFPNINQALQDPNRKGIIYDLFRDLSPSTYRAEATDLPPELPGTSPAPGFDTGDGIE
jgi:hypothetical protein